MGEATEEKRKYKRFPVTTDVAYRELSTQNGSVTKKYSAKTVNVSEGGFCMEAEHAPEIGQLLELNISTPDRLDGFRALARVCWVDESPPFDGNVKFGVEFYKVKTADKSEIVDAAKKGLWKNPA